MIALPYGTDTDWLKNLMVAGTATIVHDGTAHQVEQPTVESLSSQLVWFPPSDQRMLRRFGVEHCVHVVRSDAAGAPSPDADRMEQSSSNAV